MEISSNPTRRDRRIERQRHEILDAAAQVFAQKGFAATTTRDIADAADLGESTLYNYFSGKREIFMAVAQFQSEAIDAIFDELPHLESRRQMADAFVRVMDLLFSNAYYTRAVIGEAWVSDEILAQFLGLRLANISLALQSYIQARVRAGAFRPVDPSLAARMAISVFMGCLLPALRGVEPAPTPAERRRIADEVIALWMDGIELRRQENHV